MNKVDLLYLFFSNMLIRIIIQMERYDYNKSENNVLISGQIKMNYINRNNLLYDLRFFDHVILMQ